MVRYEKRKNRRQKMREKTIHNGVGNMWLCCPLFILIICCIVILMTYLRPESSGAGKQADHSPKDRAEDVRPGGLKPSKEQEILKLDGKEYRRNTAIRAILCIGVDTRGDMEVYEAAGMAGQADGLFLIAQDMARDTVKILMIPRDTMTEITLFDLMGNELGKDRQHLTLAYAYGDGREGSCELMADAVSELMFGLKIDGTIAANISSVSILNDAAGGVTVTIRDEGLESKDPMLKKGSTVCLSGEQAELFVRYRDITKAQTAIGRMERQKQYMEEYIKTVKKRAGTDKTLITRLVNEIETHMITDMAKDQYMDMGLAILNSRQQIGQGDFLTVPGEAVQTARFDEFHPELEELKRVVIGLFYKEVR